jgi:hypothetical protein
MGRTLLDRVLDGDMYIVWRTDPSQPTSAFRCAHLCCNVPDDPSHQHLFAPSECLDCQAIERGNR